MRSEQLSPWGKSRCKHLPKIAHRVCQYSLVLWEDPHFKKMRYWRAVSFKCIKVLTVSTLDGPLPCLCVPTKDFINGCLHLMIVMVIDLFKVLGSEKQVGIHDPLSTGRVTSCFWWKICLIFVKTCIKLTHRQEYQCSRPFALAIAGL